MESNDIDIEQLINNISTLSLDALKLLLRETNREVSLRIPKDPVSELYEWSRIREFDRNLKFIFKPITSENRGWSVTAILTQGLEVERYTAFSKLDPNDCDNNITKRRGKKLAARKALKNSKFV